MSAGADLKALAERLERYGDNDRDEAAAILRTLADADAKMPVVWVQEWTRNCPVSLVRQSDAQAAILTATARAEKDAKDAARYRWLRANNSHHVHNRAWLNTVTATKDSPCDILSADEAQEMLDAEVDRRMALKLAAIDQHLGDGPTVAGSPSAAAPREAG
jgi:glutathione S-transferase